MNLFLLEPEEAVSGNVVLPLSDERAHHLRSVKRVGPGDLVDIGILGGQRGRAKVVGISKTQIELQLLAVDQDPPAGLSGVQLIVGVARPQIMKRVFYNAAMLGVGEIVVCGADKSEASYFQSKLFREEQYFKFLREGLEQAMATQLPVVRIFSKFHHLIEQAPFASKHHKLLADAAAEESLMSLEPGFEKNIECVLAVGPEGGWQGAEIQALISAGFFCFSMGERILRVDTAVCTALAQLSLLLSD